MNTRGKTGPLFLALLSVLCALGACSGPDDDAVAPAPRKPTPPKAVVPSTIAPPVLSKPQDATPVQADETVARRPVSGSLYPLLPEPLTPAARAEGAAILARLRETRRLDWGQGGCGYHRAGFNDPNTDLQLFARGYPELAEQWACRMGESSSLPWELRPAAHVLSELARHHYGRSEAALRRLCQSSDDFVRKEAQAYVARKDRAALLAMVLEGDPNAMDLLSSQADPEALAFCRRLIDRWADRPPPWPEARENATLAVARLEALTANKWEDWVRTILEKESSAHPHFFWALELATNRRPRWLHATLRDRLASESRKHPPRLDPPGENGFVFDLVLLSLAESGGSVSEQELSYLRSFGFACDPREWLIDALGLAPRLRKNLALERVLKNSKFGLADVVRSSLREIGTGTAVSARLTFDSNGSGWAKTWIATGKTTSRVETSLQNSGGCVVPEETDYSELAKAAKTTLIEAIETALQKEPGAAIDAGVSFKDPNKAEFSVHVYSNGKIRTVAIDADRGQITGVKDGGTLEDFLRR